MKLTESKIKEIILEELQAVNEEESEQQEKTNSLSALKKFYLDLSREISSVSGMSSTEAEEIAEINKIMIKTAGQGEISKILQYAKTQLSRKLGIEK